MKAPPEFLLVEQRDRKEPYAAVGTAPVAWQVIEQRRVGPVKPTGGLVEQCRGS